MLTLLVFAGFLCMVSAFYPEGKILLRTILIPGDPDMTLQAAETFAKELGSGFSLAEAAENLRTMVQRHGNPG